MEINKEIVNGYSFFTLKNSSGLEITFCDLGASMYQIKVHGVSMTMTPINKEDFFLVGNYHGKTLGRVGNRIKNGQFTIGDKTYNLPKNEGNNTLHGGANPISQQKFDYIISEADDYTNVIFNYLSKDGESGFPGNMEIRISFKIYENVNAIEIVYNASVDQTTPCSFTNHTFFTLGESSVKNLTLKINSSKYLHPNPVDLIADGIREVEPILDFRNGKNLGEDLYCDELQNGKTKGYDHHYYLDIVDYSKPSVILSSNKIEMEIYSDHTGVQIYTDNYPSDYDFYDVPTSVPHRSIAIEPQEDHYSIHLLNKNEIYEYSIKYVFKDLK